jgi:hypothetical protein
MTSNYQCQSGYFSQGLEIVLACSPLPVGWPRALPLTAVAAAAAPPPRPLSLPPPRCLPAARPRVLPPPRRRCGCRAAAAAAAAAYLRPRAATAAAAAAAAAASDSSCWSPPPPSMSKGKGKGRRRHRKKKWRKVEGMWVNSKVPLTRGQQHHLECRRVCRQRRQERGTAAVAAAASAVPAAAVPAENTEGFFMLIEIPSRRSNEFYREVPRVEWPLLMIV